MQQHPLANVHSGRPRKNMINAYFHGYYYMGLYPERLRIAWRPTTIGPDGYIPQDLHMVVYQR